MSVVIDKCVAFLNSKDNEIDKTDLVDYMFEYFPIMEINKFVDFIKEKRGVDETDAEVGED